MRSRLKILCFGNFWQNSSLRKTGPQRLANASYMWVEFVRRHIWNSSLTELAARISTPTTSRYSTEKKSKFPDLTNKMLLLLVSFNVYFKHRCYRRISKWIYENSTDGNCGMPIFAVPQPPWVSWWLEPANKKLHSSALKKIWWKCATFQKV